ATDTIRDQVIRYNSNSAVYNKAYINKRVLFDVLSAVLERPSANSILRILTYISFIRNPRALIHIPDDILTALPPDPSIVGLKKQRAQLKAKAYKIQRIKVEAEQEREYIKPVVKYQIPEQAQLAELLYTYITSITTQEIITRRIHFISFIIAFYRRREVPR
ncbi:hypothetical protein DL98DRAFT_443130, partial [Cadophora sp. DSE1049]